MPPHPTPHAATSSLSFITIYTINILPQLISKLSLIKSPTANTLSHSFKSPSNLHQFSFLSSFSLPLPPPPPHTLSCPHLRLWVLICHHHLSTFLTNVCCVSGSPLGRGNSALKQQSAHSSPERAAVTIKSNKAFLP